MIGEYLALPWAGVLFIVTATGATANLLGSDGSALWMTLTMPSAERHDIRGRQLAWLLMVGPVAFFAAATAIAISGHYWTIPFALSLTAAALGAGGGLVVLNSVYRLEPMIDAHKRGNNLFDHPVGWWQFMSLFVLALILLAPTFGVLLLGTALESEELLLLGVPAGIATGWLYYWGFGRLAYIRLEAKGPELLNFMLRGKEGAAQQSEAGDTKPTFDAVTKSMSPRIQLIFYGCMFVGMLATFPQGLVPLIIKLAGGGAPSWFLALFLSEVYQWSMIAFMLVCGVLLLGNMSRLYFSYRKRLRPERQTEEKRSKERGL
ncbi:ABC-2 type transport system permease protein [Paenibacillus sp. UNC496MF]|uniref:hypothetical protein n=1 Tax=Paenibacillus sp. UNC496MF TaxID=1502753 RepID=UPI0008F13A25|nr:hypothetical protein [Paenibacillus sp. UNC496MF]SFJ76762.1 ABC-2 type transport system permease protein [Paenibacillus sp. UNC496MF]